MDVCMVTRRAFQTSTLLHHPKGLTREDLTSALAVEAFERGFDVVAKRQREHRGRRNGSRNPSQTDDRNERPGNFLRGGSSRQCTLDCQLVRRLTGVHGERRAEAYQRVDLVLEARDLPIRLARENRGDQSRVPEGELAKAIRVVIHSD